MTKDDSVSKSKLASDVIGQMEIGSDIAAAIKMGEDIKAADSIKGTVANGLTDSIGSQAQGASVIATWDGYKILKYATSTLPIFYKYIFQQQYNQLVASATGYKIAANLMAQDLKTYSAVNSVDVLTAALFDIPQDFISTRVRKYYNSKFAMEDPSENDMYILFTNGMKKTEDILTQYMEDKSYSATDAANLMKLRYWQIGVPSLKEAWTMVQRALWSKTDWMNLAQLGHGFTKDDAEALFSLYNYDPSLGDVMNLAQLIPLDPVWVAQKFARTGMSTADQAVFVSAMNKKVIRDEIRTFWGQIIGVYAYGGYSKEELTQLLTDWQFSTAEINIKLQTADLVKAKQVNSLMRDADVYLYRAGTINEKTLFDRLVAQNIPEEMANAITRCEAAKKGTDWELTG